MAVAVPLPSAPPASAPPAFASPASRFSFKNPSLWFRVILSETANTTCNGIRYSDLDGLSLVMSMLADMYSDSTNPLPVCIDKSIYMSYFYPNSRGQIVPFLSGITDSEIMRSKIAKLKKGGVELLPDETNEYIIRGSLDRNRDAFEVNKKRFRECKYSYTFVPLHLRSFNGFDGVTPAQNHQNGILISKKGNVIRIEPSGSQDSSTNIINNVIDKGVLDVANKIGLTDATFIPINQVCPQAITTDENCMFWTLFICHEIMKNVNKIPDPNDVIALYSSKPKEELEELIKQFKVELVQKIIPNGLRKINCNWHEFTEFITAYPSYNGAGRHRRKTRKRKTRRRKSKKAKKSTRPF